MKATRRFVTSVVLVFLIVAGLIGTILVTGMKPKLGLDLQGGLSVVLTAPNGTPSDKINEAVNIPPEPHRPGGRWRAGDLP